jgi:hypothetical protein
MLSPYGIHTICFPPLKGVVSQDLHICFWYHSIDLKFLHLMEPFICFLNFVFVSQHSELTCPSPGLKDKIFSIGFT